MPNHIDSRVALVTGGVRGIGAAIARRLLEDGMAVTVTARSEASFEDFLGTVPPEPASRASFRTVDLGCDDSLEGLLAWIKTLPRLDAVVNNAGTNLNNALPDVRTEDLDYLHRVNLRAPILIMRAASKVMGGPTTGRIVNVASIWSLVTRGGRIAYSSTKFGLVGATMTAAVDLAARNILVNAISPGFTLTELTRRTVSPEDEAMLASRIPLGRFAAPGEMASLVSFLCGLENTYITGQNIAVDGGYTVV